MSTESGTSTPESTLNVPKSEDELFSMMSEAVSNGNEEEVNRLMALEVGDQPDANDEADDQDEPANAGDDGTDATPSQDAANPSSSQEAATPSAAASSPGDAPLTKAQYDQLMIDLHQAKSKAGRVDSLQSAISRLERQMQEERAARVAATPKPENDTVRKLKERIATLREVDSNLADTLELQLELLESKEEPATPTPTQPQTEQHSNELDPAELQSRFKMVETVHPDAAPIFRHPSWAMWKASLTPERLDWAESDDPAKVIVALNAFKADYQTAVAKQTPTSTSPPAPAAENPTNTARERKLQQSAPVRNAPIKGTSAQDEDAMFSEVYKQILEENHIK